VTEAGEPLLLPWLADARFGCFGCSPHNASGLALSLRRLPDGRVGAWAALSERFASYPGIVHGGLISTLVDEVMGTLVAVERGRLAFCATLRTRMLAPLRTGHTYLCAARLLDAGAGSTVVRAEADVSDKDGEVLVTATGTYQPIDARRARAMISLDDAGYASVQDYFDYQMGT
jgi:acyl-coenzyme A thioesterase PaaI-like protein